MSKNASKPPLEASVRDLNHILGAERVIPADSGDTYTLYPRSTADVAAIVKWAKRHQVVVGCCPRGAVTEGGPDVFLVWDGMNRLLEVDVYSNLVQAQAGISLRQLESELNQAGYTTGYVPGGADRTLAYHLAMRSVQYGGPQYGGLDQLVVSLEAVLPAGTVIRTPQAPRRATGIDPRALLLGTGGHFGIVCSATMRVFPRFAQVQDLAFYYSSDSLACEALRLLLRHEISPTRVAIVAGQRGTQLGLEGFPARGAVLLLSIGLGVPGSDDQPRRASKRLTDLGDALTEVDVAGWWSAVLDQHPDDGLELSLHWDGIEPLFGSLPSGLVDTAVVTHCGKHGAVIVLGGGDDGERAAAVAATEAQNGGWRDLRRASVISPRDQQLRAILDTEGVIDAGEA
ncbi:MAG: FAD-binding oxidoreductase [Myxococcales bacterium]|nr:FAD-binding oxidoreductase [Myxococcales bacterium]